MRTYIIAAKDPNGCIGKGNTIPWKIKEEMQHFKETTTGHTVVMGYATWKSFGTRTVLPNRTNVVLTRSNERAEEILNHHLPNLLAAHSISDAEYIHTSLNKEKDVYIIGGAQIYDLYLKEKKVDEMILSVVTPVVENGDTFFPEYDLKEWHCMPERIIHDQFAITRLVR